MQPIQKYMYREGDFFNQKLANIYKASYGLKKSYSVARHLMKTNVKKKPAAAPKAGLRQGPI